MTLETWVSLAVIVTAFAGMYVALRRESRGDIAELVSHMDRRFDVVDRRLDAVDRRLDAVDRRFDAVDRRFESMEDRFAQQTLQFEARFNGIEGRIDGLHDDIRRLDDRVYALAVGLRPVLERAAVTDSESA